MNGKLVVDDFVNNRFLELTDRSELREVGRYEKSFDTYKINAISEKEFIRYDNENGIEVFRDFKKTVSLPTFDSQTTGLSKFFQFRSFIFENDVMFIWDKNNLLWSVPHPINDLRKNRSQILDSDETIRYLIETNQSQKKIEVVNRGRLFVNGELQTRDWETFRDFFSEQTKLLNPPAYAQSRPYLGYLDQFPRDLSFLGRDNDGNYYWNSGRRTIFVFDKLGWIQLIFRYDMHSVWGYPSISKNGDVYFVGGDENNNIVKIYTISRSW